MKVAFRFRLLDFPGKNRIIRFGRIQTRLSLYFILLLGLAIAAVSVVSNHASTGAIHSKAQLYSVQVMNQISQNLSLDLNHMASVMDDITSSEEIQTGLERYQTAAPGDKFRIENQINKLFAHKQSLLPFVTSASIAAAGSDLRFGNSANYLNREQYARIVESSLQSAGIHYSLIDYATGEALIVIDKSFKSAVSGKVLGTLVLSMKERHLSDIYRQVDLGNQADIFIMDRNGTIISSRDSGKIPVRTVLPDSALVSRIVGDSAGTLTNHFYGVDSLVSFSPISNTDWYVVSAIPEAFLQQELNQLTRTILWIGVLCLLVSAVAAYVISLSISIPSKRIVRWMGQAKEGDFSLSVKEPFKDEIGTIANHFGEMIQNVRVLLKQVDATSRDLVNQSFAMDDSAESTRQTAEQYVAISQQVAEGAASQAADANEGVVIMGQLSDKIQIATGDIEMVSAGVIRTRDISEQAVTVVRSLNEKAENATVAMRNVVTDIDGLNRNMKQVSSIVDVMVGITKSTRILSMNASIEAARAGHAGKGFAVVAQEVKKLAEECNKALGSVREMIQSANEKTAFISGMAVEAGVALQEQQQAVRETDTAFQGISTSMGEVAVYIAKVNESVRNIVIEKEKTLDVMQTISKVAEDTASTMEETYAGTEEQLSHAEQLSGLAKSLNRTAQELSRAIAAFKVD